MKSILFLTGTESPFQTELAAAINALGELRYTLAFDEAHLGDRGAHWRTGEVHDHVVRYQGSGGRDLEGWTEQVVASVKPDVVIVGGIRGERFERAARLARGRGARLGVFAEQPNPKSGLAEAVFEAAVVPAFRRRVDLVLAVGDTAVQRYCRWLRRPQDVHWFPYYQRLTRCEGRRYDESETRFLFSGRLIPRNRPENVLLAFEEIVDAQVGTVSLCISGKGPSEGLLRAIESKYTNLAGRVRYDRDFAEWNDRLRPFQQSDILVLPARHSGWGLVVPEALAMGMAVVTTWGVEAARHMVRHGQNGLLCDGSVAQLAEAMRVLAKERMLREKMQRCAARSADDFDVSVGARRFVDILGPYLDSRWGAR